VAYVIKGSVRLKAEEKRATRRLAEQSIDNLFELALGVYPQEPQLAQRYTAMARRVGMRSKVRIPKKWKLLICRRCKGFLLPGSNCRVRIQQKREPHLTITCLNCGGVKRIPIKRSRSSL